MCTPLHLETTLSLMFLSLLTHPALSCSPPSLCAPYPPSCISPYVHPSLLALSRLHSRVPYPPSLTHIHPPFPLTLSSPSPPPHPFSLLSLHIPPHPLMSPSLPSHLFLPSSLLLPHPLPISLLPPHPSLLTLSHIPHPHSPLPILSLPLPCLGALPCRLIESQIEDLRRNSSLPSPFMLSTPTEHSQ